MTSIIQDSEGIVLEKRVQIIDNKVCLSSGELMSVLNISKQSLSVWRSKGCPQQCRGWWAIEDVLKWRGLTSEAGLKTEEQIEEMGLAQQKAHWEIKYKQLQSESLELKNAISRGDYIEKTEIVQELSRCLVVLKKSFQGMARRIGANLSGKLDTPSVRVIEDDIKHLINEALEQISITGVYP